MNCVLDNIIFSLQRSGGISVVWQEHLKRLLCETDFNCEFIEYKNASDNILRKSLRIPTEKINKRSSSLIQFKRFINIHGDDTRPYIFHSSYYRIDKSQNAHNVTTVHDFTYFKYFKGFRKLLNCRQQLRAIQNSQTVICVSENTKKDLLSYMPDFDDSKIHVVYNGVSTSYKQISREEYKFSLPFENNEFILYVGNRAASYKNFNTVVEVCSLMKIPLVIAGGGVLSDSEKHILDLKLGNLNYASFPHLLNEELNELYNRAMLLLYPSIYEGFGIPIVEAQRAGCPVIAINTSSIPEVMGSSDLLLKEDSAEAIHEAVLRIGFDSQLRKDEIQRGLRNSKKFSWDKTYEETIKLYKQISSTIF